MKPFQPDDSWLYGYAVAGIAGVAEDSQAYVGPLSQVNFLVGRNNHGKSTLLRAAANWAVESSTAASPKKRATLIPANRQALEAMLRKCGVADSKEQHRRLAHASLVRLNKEWIGVWTDCRPNRSSRGGVDVSDFNRSLKQQLGLDRYSISYPPDSVVQHVASKAVLIPAFRQMRVAPGEKSADIASGEGLISELSTWERPKNPGTPDYLAAKDRWSRLGDFLRDVLEDPEADLEVAGASNLHVKLAQASSMLDIDSLGDGVKQVLMIAAACIYFDDHLVLLEEPEIHLHAGLQRKLMRFLAERTSNQYVIATHSAHVLDLPGARIFHVTHDGRSTQVASAVRASDVQQVCVDLGYMASDILQANFTIWVEGPSDRVYWARWLELLDPGLVEGVHFTIMSYGGYLIDSVHLRDEPDPATEDLVQLLKLGRQCVVIADSDKSADSDKLRPTLQRLQNEAAQPGSGDVVVCDWVRTVENLLPRQLFRETVIGQHPQAGKRLKNPDSFGPFDEPFANMKKGTYSKVAIAKALAPKLTRGDLDDRHHEVLDKLVASIRSANGLYAAKRAPEAGFGS